MEENDPLVDQLDRETEESLLEYAEKKLSIHFKRFYQLKGGDDSALSVYREKYIEELKSTHKFLMGKLEEAFATGQVFNEQIRRVQYGNGSEELKSSIQPWAAVFAGAFDAVEFIQTYIKEKGYSCSTLGGEHRTMGYNIIWVMRITCFFDF